MIDIVTGQVATITDNYVVLLVGGIGLRIYTPTTVRDMLDGRGQTLTLFTHLVR